MAVVHYLQDAHHLLVCHQDVLRLVGQFAVVSIAIIQSIVCRVVVYLVDAFQVDVFLLDAMDAQAR